MNRRQMLGSLLSVGSVGLLRSTDAVAQPTKIIDLDQFNASVACMETIGNWRIGFTGLKGSRDDNDLAGQWTARGTIQGHHRYFVGVVPFVVDWGCMEYRPGSVFPIRTGISFERLIADPQGIRTEIAEGKSRLITGLAALGLL